MIRLFLIIFFGAAIGLEASATATLNCPGEPGEGVYYCCQKEDMWPLSKADDIPVYVNVNVGALCGSSSTCSSFLEVESMVISALSEMYSTSSSRLRYRYAGPTSISGVGGPASTIHGAVHVYAGPCNDGILGQAASNRTYSENGIWKGYGQVNMCTSNVGGDIKWSASNTRGSRVSFRGVFLHEMGHISGQSHLEDCMTVPVAPGLMTQNGSNQPSDNIMVPSIEFMKDIYGDRSNVGNAYWSTTGANWWASANAPTEANLAIGRYSATNSRSGSNMIIGWRTSNHQVGLSTSTGGTWSFHSNLPHFGWYHVGVASVTNSKFMAAFQVHWERILGKTDIKIRQTTNNGSSWSSPVLQNDAATKTTAPGVNSTYDPESDQYITLWRLQGLNNQTTSPNRNIIVFRVSGASAPGKLTGLHAADTPSIACGPASVVGTENCILTYLSDDDWGGPVTWHRCKVSGSNLVCSAAQNHFYATAGSPSVAYSGNSYPWTMLLTQGGNWVYSWRSQATSPPVFTDERSVSYSPQAIVPAAGSRLTGSDRRYVFSMDD